MQRRKPEEMTHEEIERFVKSQIEDNDELAVLCAQKDYENIGTPFSALLKKSAKVQAMDEEKLNNTLAYQHSVHYTNHLREEIAIQYYYFKKLESKGLNVHEMIDRARVYAYWHIYSHHGKRISSSYSTCKLHVTIGKGLPMVMRILKKYHNFRFGNIRFLPLSSKINVQKLIAFVRKLKNWYFLSIHMCYIFSSSCMKCIYFKQFIYLQDINKL